MSLARTENGIASQSYTWEKISWLTVRPRGGGRNRWVWPGQEMELRHSPAHGKEISWLPVRPCGKNGRRCVRPNRKWNCVTSGTWAGKDSWLAVRLLGAGWIDGSSLYKKWNQNFMEGYHLTTPRNSWPEVKLPTFRHFSPGLVSLCVLQVEGAHHVVVTPHVLWHQVHLRSGQPFWNR